MITPDGWKYGARKATIAVPAKPDLTDGRELLALEID